MTDPDIVAAEYVLGLSRTEQRKAIEEQLNSDVDLHARVQRWQDEFATLDAEGGETLPDGLLQSVLARIDSQGVQLPGSITLRGAGADWQRMSEGVAYRMLREDKTNGRQSFLVRMDPGAVYPPHPHDEDEECLMIEGDLRFGDLELHAGDYHVALKGMSHPAGRTVQGCLLHITTFQPSTT